MEETYRARQCQPTTAVHALLVDRDACRCGTGGGWAFSLGGAPPPPTVDVANDTTPCRGGNVTYVQVHKCSGTSIQSAMYARTRAIRATAMSTSLSYRAEVRTYKHSF